MAFSETIIAITAFLSVSATAVFTLLVISIRRGDRGQHLSDAPTAALDVLARGFLGVSACRGDHEED